MPEFITEQEGLVFFAEAPGKSIFLPQSFRGEVGVFDNRAKAIKEAKAHKAKHGGKVGILRRPARFGVGSRYTVKGTSGPSVRTDFSQPDKPTRKSRARLPRQRDFDRA